MGAKVICSSMFILGLFTLRIGAVLIPWDGVCIGFFWDWKSRK